MIDRLICLAIGYCFGLIQTAYIYGRMHGIDIRKVGSGNAGSTNTMRTFGKKAGIANVFCDAGKCVAAVFVVWLLYHNDVPDITRVLGIYASAGVILGHNFPFYLHFKGGKGIAATAGMVIAFRDWKLIPINLAIFLIIVLLTKYVSLGSLVISVGFLVEIFIGGQSGLYGLDQRYLTEIYIVVAMLVVLAFYMHRGNIVRLLHGEERKIYLIGKEK